MSQNVEIAVDSLLGKELIRILLNIENRDELSFVITRSVFRKFLKIKRLKRNAEGLVYSFETANPDSVVDFFEQVGVPETGVQKPLAKVPANLIVPDISNVEDKTEDQLERLRTLQAELRRMMEERDR